jgi:zinc transporter
MTEPSNQIPDPNTPTIIWAYHIDPQIKAVTLLSEQAYQNKPETGFVWYHMQADAKESATQLRTLGLEKAVIDGLCTAETRPKAMQIGQGMLVYLRGINRNPDADPEDMVSLRLWISSDRIISARRKNRKLLSVQDAREELENTYVPLTPLDLMLKLITKTADRISETVDILDEELSTFETYDRMAKQDRLKLSIVRRQSAAIRRYLAPQRDALDAIYRFNKSLSQEQAFELRDQTDRMTRYVEDLDLAKERAMVLQDELRNRIAEQQGMRMYVLSLVTAVFLPLSFLTGVFGMNVAGLPGTEDPKAFTYLAIGMAALASVSLLAMVIKRWF